VSHTLTLEDIEAIASKVAEKLRLTPAQLAAPLPEVIGTAEAQRLLGVASPSALYRRLAKLGIKRVAQGTYRRADIINGIARATLPKKAAPAPRA
jgi:hypothetical protein